MTERAIELHGVRDLEERFELPVREDAISHHSCRVCGSQTFRRWGAHEGHQMYQCLECDLTFFFPYPTENELNCFYNGAYHQQRGYSGTTLAGQLRQQMYQLDIADLERTVPGKGKILDVGCAEGLFLSKLTSAGWERYGMDVSTPAIESARRQHPHITFFDCPIDRLPVPDRFFDVVHLRGVFEHLLFPDEILKILKKKLKASGTLAISNTPNARGLCGELFRNRFKLVMYEHVTYPSIRTIKRLFLNNDIRLIRIRYPYFGSPYAAPLKDLWGLGWNLVTGAKSPPFHGNIFTMYGRSA